MSGNSETNASELLDSIEEMLLIIVDLYEYYPCSMGWHTTEEITTPMHLCFFCCSKNVYEIDDYVWLTETFPIVLNSTDKFLKI